MHACRASAQCPDIPTHTPHRGGLWLFTVSHEDEQNQGCAVQHAPEEQQLNVPWNRNGYVIAGR